MGFYSGGETALQSHQGSPCSAFLRVDGGSEWNFENELSGARRPGICTKSLGRRRLSKIIE